MLFTRQKSKPFIRRAGRVAFFLVNSKPFIVYTRRDEFKTDGTKSNTRRPKRTGHVISIGRKTRNSGTLRGAYPHIRHVAAYMYCTSTKTRYIKPTNI
jgi:hypothetical protein